MVKAALIALQKNHSFAEIELEAHDEDEFSVAQVLHLTGNLVFAKCFASNGTTLSNRIFPAGSIRELRLGTEYLAGYAAAEITPDPFTAFKDCESLTDVLEIVSRSGAICGIRTGDDVFYGIVEACDNEWVRMRPFLELAIAFDGQKFLKCDSVWAVDLDNSVCQRIAECIVRQEGNK